MDQKRTKNIKKSGLLLALFCFLVADSWPAGIQKTGEASPSQIERIKIDPRLWKKLNSLASTDTLNIWVFFTDKGALTQFSLERKLAQASSSLNSRCRWRRLKVRSEKNIVDFEDLPLFDPYMEEIRPLVKKVRTLSRWLNAMSVEANYSQIQEVAKLDSVQRISLVASFRRDDTLPPEEGLSQEPEQNKNKDESAYLDYGPSFKQLDQIQVPPLHRLGYSGKNILVCLLDTGFRKTHEAFRMARVVAEWDFVNGDGDVEQDRSDPNDYSDSHGTATWSLLGGYKPGQIIGPAFGADFILAKTETTRFEQPIEEDYWMAGIEWAEGLGAEVVSSSLGYLDWYTFEDLDGKTAVTTRAANRATTLGVVVVNAVGNERNTSWGRLIAPADAFEIIAVGAVNSSGVLATFSSPGPTFDGRIKPEVLAQGVDNWIAANREDGTDIYRRGSGTSYSTPLVAGVAALLLEIHPDWTPQQVRAALMGTASRSIKPDNDYGYGIANAALAASLALALPKLQYFSIDDDASGESRGNGNGQAEPGETLEVTLTLRNEGQVPAVSLEATLTSSHPDIQVLRPKVSFPYLPASDFQPSVQPFLVKIPVRFLGHHAVFLTKIEGPNSQTVYDTLRITISR